MREQKETSGVGRDAREAAMREAVAAAPVAREAPMREDAMTEVDQAIRQVEQLYRSLTGSEPPAGDRPYAPIPPERDPNRWIEEQMDRLMAALGRSPQPTRAAAPWVPAVSIWESPRETVIVFELAGIARDGVEVSVSQNLLIVSGQRGAPELDGGDYQLRAAERPLGPFRRVVALPPTAQVEQLSATMKDGLLEIRVPRANQQSATQTIPIR
jgi:HSP20 family protein